MWDIPDLQPYFPKLSIQERLRSGGYKHTYRANLPDGTSVALKVFSTPRPAEDDDPQSEHLRAAREIRLLEGFDHPRIVKIARSASFVDIDGAEYLAYCEEFAVNGTLDGLVLPLEAPRTKQIVLGVVNGLEYLEHRGVVHRDIKPANIGLKADDQPVLLDFGVALDRRDDDITGYMDVAPGTRAYAAPEQFVPRRLVTLDHRADQHALGVVATELLTGSTDPAAEDWENVTVSDCFRTVINRLTAVAPNRRFRRTEMLRTALEDCNE